MSRKVDPEALLLPRRKARIDEVVDRRVRGLTVLFENVHDPHNLAAVLRTAEGLGLQDVHVIQAKTGFRPNAAVTQGADKWLDVHKHADAASAASALEAAGFRVFGSRLTGDAVDVEALPFQDKLALAFGNEHDGISDALAARCAGFFRIPMAGFAQSFNVSVAAGITLALAMSMRRKLGLQQGLSGDLDAASKDALRQRFYALSADLP